MAVPTVVAEKLTPSVKQILYMSTSTRVPNLPLIEFNGPLPRSLMPGGSEGASAVAIAEGAASANRSVAPNSGAIARAVMLDDAEGRVALRDLIRLFMVPLILPAELSRRLPRLG